MTVCFDRTEIGPLAGTVDLQMPRTSADHFRENVMSSSKIVLSTPITHSDWVWQYQKRIGHRDESVRYILDRCKAAGLNRVYWRVFDGGQAFYKSKLRDGLEKGYDADNIHAWCSPGKPMPDIFREYRGFDSLESAVGYGHKIGIEVHAWLTINEEDHGWGLMSRFCRANPQWRWVRRCGTPFISQMSFAFPEVRKYKLASLKEILSYDIDGVFFDWMRTGDVRTGAQADATGTADFGYETPMIEGFKAKYRKDPREIPNNDPRWVAFRAEPITEFMTQAHKLIKRKGKHLPIVAMGQQNLAYRGDTPKVDGCLNGLLLNIKEWSKRGIVDAVCAAGYYRKGGNAEKAVKYLRGEVGKRCDVWLWEWMPAKATEFRASVKRAEKTSARQILYWESDYIDQDWRKADAPALTAAMAEFAQGQS